LRILGLKLSQTTCLGLYIVIDVDSSHLCKLEEALLHG